MKNLKVILTPFYVLILFSVLLISCDQEVINLDDNIAENVAVEQPTNYNGLLLPNAVIEQGETYMIEFLNNASEEDIMNYHNDYITFKFLQEVGKLDSVLDENNQMALKNVDLSTILSADEMNALNNAFLNSNTITERGCWHPVRVWNGWCQCWQTVSWWCSCC